MDTICWSGPQRRAKSRRSYTKKDTAACYITGIQARLWRRRAAVAVAAHMETISYQARHLRSKLCGGCCEQSASRDGRRPVASLAEPDQGDLQGGSRSYDLGMVPPPAAGMDQLDQTCMDVGLGVPS